MEYLGVSNNKWNLMAEEAEAMLIERGIGQHIIGLYPSGGRIYGDKDATPELLCIYVDSPSKILDPFEEHQIEGYHTSENKYRILFCELFAWVKLLGKASSAQFDDRIRSFTHIIPTMLEAQYEDGQLSVITAIAGEYLKDCGWDIPQLLASREISKSKDVNLLINDALYLRARSILRSQNVFAPCVNQDWDQIEKLTEFNKDDKIFTIDDKLISIVSGGSEQPTIKELSYYRGKLIDSFYPIITNESKEKKHKLAHIVKTYLMSLL